jgi:mRNA interferase MazF
MIERRRGQIWWVDFGDPIGSEQAGMRPALIVQCDAANQARNYPMSIVCPLSSSGRDQISFHVKLTPEETGLDRIGYIKCEQVRSVAVKRFSNLVVELDAKVMTRVDRALREILQLP